MYNYMNIVCSRHSLLCNMTVKVMVLYPNLTSVSAGRSHATVWVAMYICHSRPLTYHTILLMRLSKSTSYDWIHMRHFSSYQYIVTQKTKVATYIYTTVHMYTNVWL